MAWCVGGCSEGCAGCAGSSGGAEWALPWELKSLSWSTGVSGRSASTASSSALYVDSLSPLFARLLDGVACCSGLGVNVEIRGGVLTGVLFPLLCFGASTDNERGGE